MRLAHSARRNSVASMAALIAWFMLLAGSAVLGWGAGTAQVPPSFMDERALPPGPVGERIRGLLDAVNSGDPDTIRKFVSEGFLAASHAPASIAERAAFLLHLHDQSQGFNLYGVRTYPDGGGPEGTVVIVSNRLTGAWQSFVVEIEPQIPHRITGFDLVPARPPRDLPPQPPITLEKAVTDLGAYVERLAAGDVFSGTVLLARNGKVLYRTAVGEANKSDAVPVRIDTKFNLGSMNKMFTAVAIAQLVEEGKLSWEDPLSKHLASDWLPRVDMSRIRIKHLLTHTSGLGSYFNETYDRSSRELFREVNDYKRLTADETVQFDPGSRAAYSNTGFLLLGAVVEKVSGRGYFDYVRERIYRPAGMTSTDCYDMDVAVPKLAIGYTKERGPRGTIWRNNLYKHVIRGGPAGGGFSTVEDLLRFAEALRSGKLLAPATTAVLLSAKPDLGSRNYGFGFGIAGTPLDRIVGHGGGFPGISANLDIYLDSGFTAVVLSNFDEGSEPVSQKIRELISRLEPGHREARGPRESTIVDETAAPSIAVELNRSLRVGGGGPP